MTKYFTFLRWSLIVLLFGVTSIVYGQVGSLTLTDPQVVCINSTRDYGVVLTTGSTYTWSIVDGPGSGPFATGTFTTANGNNTISVLWTAAGTCKLQVVEVNENSCEGTIVELNITVNALPTATIAYSGTPYCATGTAGVTQTGQAGGTYSSTAGLVLNSSSGEIDLESSTPGSYTVTYDFTDGTCTNTTTCSVEINALPTAAIAYSGTPYCATGTAGVTQTGQPGGTYSSTAGLVLNSSTGEIDLESSTPGSYTVTYDFTDGTCTNTTTCSVEINALPTATIAYSGTPYCATGTAGVTQTGQAGGTYSSSAGLVLNSSSGEIDLGSSTPGSYTVTYTFTDGTCQNTTSAEVEIMALPEPLISGNFNVCGGTNETYNTPATPGNSYNWEITGGAVFSGQGTNQVTVTWNSSGAASIKVTETEGTCSADASHAVTIKALPSTSAIYHD